MVTLPLRVSVQTAKKPSPSEATDAARCSPGAAMIAGGRDSGISADAKPGAAVRAVNSARARVTAGRFMMLIRAAVTARLHVRLWKEKVILVKCTKAAAMDESFWV